MNSKILAVISLIFAAGAAVYMLLWGGPVHAELNSQTGKMVVTRTGFDHPILVLYVLLPLLGLLGIQKKNLWILGASIIGMFLLVVLFFSFIGAVFLPSSLVLLTAGLFYRKESDVEKEAR